MKIITLAALTGLALAATPAAAQTSRTVSLAGIDWSKPDHVKLVNRRIAQAVETVCGSYASVEQGESAAITRCRRQAFTGARQQIASRAQPAAVVLAAR
jgi:UrcA family protein